MHMRTEADCLRLHNRHTDEVLVLRRRRRNGETILELRGSLPPHREGPPLHVHFLEDEELRVTAGRLAAEVGGQRIDIGPGEVARLPRGAPHRWWNGGDEPLAIEGTAQPAADFDSYVQAVFEVMNASPPNRPSLFYMAHVALRHRRTQSVLIMPRLLQSVLFRVVVAIGTITGRYQGTEWPGAPSRCTGAPFVED